MNNSITQEEISINQYESAPPFTREPTNMAITSDDFLPQNYKWVDEVLDEFLGSSDGKKSMTAEEFGLFRREQREKVRQLIILSQRYKEQNEKYKLEVPRIEVENEQLRNKLVEMEQQLQRTDEENEQLSETLHEQKSMFTELEEINKKLSSGLKEANQEKENTLALLQVERKIKKTIEMDLTTAKEEVTNLKKALSNDRRAHFSKRITQIKEAIGDRRAWMDSRKESSRIPLLESEIASLHQQIEVLKNEAVESARLINSLKFNSFTPSSSSSSSSSSSLSLSSFSSSSLSSFSSSSISSPGSLPFTRQHTPSPAASSLLPLCPPSLLSSPSLSVSSSSSLSSSSLSSSSTSSTSSSSLSLSTSVSPVSLPSPSLSISVPDSNQQSYPVMSFSSPPTPTSPKPLQPKHHPALSLSIANLPTSPHIITPIKEHFDSLQDQIQQIDSPSSQKNVAPVPPIGSHHEQENEIIETKLKELTKSKRIDEETIEALQLENSNLESRLTDANKAVEQEQQKRRQLEEELMKCTCHNDPERERNQKQKAEEEKQQKELEKEEYLQNEKQYQQEIEHYKALILERDESIQRLQHEIQDLKSLIDSLESRIKSLTSPRQNIVLKPSPSIPSSAPYVGTIQGVVQATASIMTTATPIRSTISIISSSLTAPPSPPSLAASIASITSSSSVSSPSATPSNQLSPLLPVSPVVHPSLAALHSFSTSTSSAHRHSLKLDQSSTPSIYAVSSSSSPSSIVSSSSVCSSSSSFMPSSTSEPSLSLSVSISMPPSPIPTSVSTVAIPHRSSLFLPSNSSHQSPSSMYLQQPTTANQDGRHRRNRSGDWRNSPLSPRLTAALDDIKYHKEKLIELRKITIARSDHQPKSKSSKPRYTLTPSQQAEIMAYSRCFNTYLEGDKDLDHILPINPQNNELLTKVRDGLLIAKFVNCAVPGTIDERALNYRSNRHNNNSTDTQTQSGIDEEKDSNENNSNSALLRNRNAKNLSSEEILENLNLCVSAAKSIGITMRTSESGNTAPDGIFGNHRRRIHSANGASLSVGDSTNIELQLMDCSQPSLVLDFLFQLIWTKLTYSINLKASPFLQKLQKPPHNVISSKFLLPEMPVQEFVQLPPLQLLIRWVNYHLASYHYFSQSHQSSPILKSTTLQSPQTNKINNYTTSGNNNNSPINVSCSKIGGLSYKISLITSFGNELKDGNHLFFLVSRLHQLKMEEKKPFSSKSQQDAVLPPFQIQVTRADSFSTSTNNSSSSSVLSPSNSTITGLLLTTLPGNRESFPVRRIIKPVSLSLPSSASNTPISTPPSSYSSLALAGTATTVLVSTLIASVLELCQEMRIKPFVQSEDILSGNPTLLQLFAAQLYQHCSALGLKSDEDDKKMQPATPNHQQQAIQQSSQPLNGTPIGGSRTRTIALTSPRSLTSRNNPNTTSFLLYTFDEKSEENREERAYRMWINSAGIPGVIVNNLFADCKDGLVLLHLVDHIEPGIVEWTEVEKKPGNNKFKCVVNCNHLLKVCSNKKMNFSLVGIGGPNIYEGHQTSLLAIAWQLMRYHIVKYLQALHSRKFGKKPVSDASIISWANQCVARNMNPKLIAYQQRVQQQHQQQATGSPNIFASSRLNPNLLSNTSASGGGNVIGSGGMGGTGDGSVSVLSIKSFRDSSLSNGLFLLNLIWVLEPRVINWKLVTDGITDDEKFLNARYAISVARKLGATIFLLPEDIVEVKPKMIMTFIASILAFDSD